MLYGIDFGRPVGVRWAQAGRGLGVGWGAGGCLGCRRWLSGGGWWLSGGSWGHILACIGRSGPQQGPQGVHRSRPGSPECVSKACPGHLQGRKSRKIEILKSAGNFPQKLSPDELLTTQRFPKGDPKDLISIPAGLQRVLRVAKCASWDLPWTSLHLV